MRPTEPHLAHLVRAAFERKASHQRLYGWLRRFGFAREIPLSLIVRHPDAFWASRSFFLDREKLLK
jgi:hypothetical protein